MNDDKLVKILGFNRVKINEPLAEHVYMRVGGPADFYYEANSSKELEEAVKVVIRLSIPFVIIGVGANVLISDKGFRGLVIKNAAKDIKFLPFGFVETGSGVENVDLINAAKNRGLSGMERMIKVPGTIGGAIFMNAGDTGRGEFFGDLVETVAVVDQNGEAKKLRKEDCGFAYRASRFQTSGEIILKVKLQLKQATKEEIESKAQDILVRKMHQPPGPTLGSTFKNPPNQKAGKLIEDVGLKGKQVGGAKFSDQHANFIINTGNAKAVDIKALIDLAKSEVKKKFGVDLQEEVRYIGEW